MAKEASVSFKVNGESKPDSRTFVRGFVSGEIIFGVVGPVGSGTSAVANALQDLLKRKGYESEVLKARNVIETWGRATGRDSPTEGKMAQTIALQDIGDAMRLETKDNAAVALRLISEVRTKRASQKGETLKRGIAVDPGTKHRAFILDSLRNPAEVALLRSVYQENFCVIGVVSEEESRKERLRDKYSDAGNEKIEELMRRDEKASEKHGQQVADTFHLADFFIDNTPPRLIENKTKAKRSNPAWKVNEELGRLVDILTHARVVRPRPNETAMFHAYGARMRSACLSRQVGAALMDRQGNIVATGTNEVPRAGGGVYGGIFEGHSDADPASEQDHRCVALGGYCRNTAEQNEIIKNFLENVEEFSEIAVTNDLIKKIRKTKIGQLIEYSRSVHAEMDALLSAARQGISPRGTRLFVTTFPCHNCARHIVAAGVDEVQFVEPYLKSQALPLHGDAITTKREKWTPPSLAPTETVETGPEQVLFQPFTGVAPRLYRRAFYKDRDLKDDFTGELLSVFGPAEGMGTPEALRVSYADIEARLDSMLQDPK